MKAKKKVVQALDRLQESYALSGENSNTDWREVARVDRILSMYGYKNKKKKK